MPVPVELVVPVSVEVEVDVDTGAESVRFSGVTFVLVPRDELVVLGLLAPPERDWPLGVDADAGAWRCPGRAAGTLAARRDGLTSVVALCPTASDWAGAAVVAVAAWVEDWTFAVCAVEVALR